MQEPGVAADHDEVDLVFSENADELGRLQKRNWLAHRSSGRGVVTYRRARRERPRDIVVRSWFGTLEQRSELLRSESWQTRPIFQPRFPSSVIGFSLALGARVRYLDMIHHATSLWLDRPGLPRNEVSATGIQRGPPASALVPADDRPHPGPAWVG